MITVSDFPKYRGKMEYVCLGCHARFDIHELYYTCPHCGGVFLLEDTTFDSLLEFPPELLARPVRQAGRHPGRRPARRAALLRAHGPGPGRRGHRLPGRGPHPDHRGQRGPDRAGGRALLLQERRPEPERLLQGPGHGLRLQLFEASGPGQRLGFGPDRVRLHRRHLGRRRPLRRLCRRSDQVRGHPAQGQGHTAAAGPAARQRRHGHRGARRLRRLHEGGGDARRQLPGGPAQFEKRLAHPRPGVLRLRGGPSGSAGTPTASAFLCPSATPATSRPSWAAF